MRHGPSRASPHVARRLHGDGRFRKRTETVRVRFLFARLQRGLASPCRCLGQAMSARSASPAGKGTKPPQPKRRVVTGGHSPEPCLGRNTDARPADAAGMRGCGHVSPWDTLQRSGGALGGSRRAGGEAVPPRLGTARPRKRRTSCAPIQGMVTRSPPLRKDDCTARSCVFRWWGGPSGERGSPLGSIPPPDERRRPGTDVKTPVQEPTPAGGGSGRAVAPFRRGWELLREMISCR